jgi:hypothetical protein
LVRCKTAPGVVPPRARPSDASVRLDDTVVLVCPADEAQVTMAIRSMEFR